jgi:hypothetical protein
MLLVVPAQPAAATSVPTSVTYSEAFCIASLIWTVSAVMRPKSAELLNTVGIRFSNALLRSTVHSSSNLGSRKFTFV